MKSTTYQQQAQMITEDVLEAMQRESVLMLQQNKTHKNDILKALQVVADKETTPTTSKFSTKRKHEELGITTQDKIQLKMLKMLENIETKLSNQPNPNSRKSKPIRSQYTVHQERG